MEIFQHIKNTTKSRSSISVSPNPTNTSIRILINRNRAERSNDYSVIFLDKDQVKQLIDELNNLIND